MSFPFVAVFLGLLLAYMVYSAWARLDPRYPVVAGVVLLVITAGVDASGATDTANLLAEFVFFLIGAGVVLLLVDHARARFGGPSGGGQASVREPSEPPEERQRPAEELLDRLEQEPVPAVNAPRE